MPSLAAIFRQNPRLRVVVPQAYEASGFPAPDSEPEQEDAEVVEGSEFSIYPGVSAGASGFQHFLDGAQRSWLVSYNGPFSVYFSHISAAILPRDESRLVRGPGAGQYEAKEALFGYRLSELPEYLELAAAFRVHELETMTNEAPDAIAEKIQTRISVERGRLESHLARSYDGPALLVDGGLGDAMSGKEDDRLLVGVVKSHRRQYFQSPDRVEKVLGMKPGDRSSVFRRNQGVKDTADAFSFYLKLHDSPDHGPMFGMVRVEIPAHEELLNRVDEITGWLLAERAPLSLPDPRYHRMLYPVRRVEQYLKSRQPSEAALRGKLGK